TPPAAHQNCPVHTAARAAASLAAQHAFLRRPDQLHLVRPPPQAGAQRRYTRHEVTIVAYVLRLVEDGLTLAAVRRVLHLEEQVRRLEERVRELESERDALAAALGRRDELVAGSRPFGKIKRARDAGRPS